ncbi:MAG: hypothetical protein PHD15_02670 [Clostridia bacterium]|nr:hypothetical protein [Clostridia bacterium]MDD4386651.1 hypothetical protein [Clostridia bacterium]
MEEDLSKKVNDTLLKYENTGKKEILEYINAIILSKNGKWDLGINESSQGLTKMLLCEYAMAIENLSNVQLKAKFVIDKLANQMGTLRYGDFKKKQDDNIKYDKNAVTSNKYTTQCRVESNFGAHTISYEENDKIQQDAVVLFDDKQTLKDGTKLSGIDFSNLSDIRHTIFHEWTHVMEKCLVERKDLKENIIYRQGNSTYINSLLSADLTMNEYQNYIDNIFLSNEAILFGGISTIEINLEKNPNKRIMHNQISEGCTEYISRLVMEEVGDTVEHPERYSKQVEIAKKVFTSRGLEDSLKDYLTCSNKIISELESCSIDGKDLLHYMSDFINLLPNINEFFKNKVDDKKNDEIKNKVMELWKTNPTQKSKVDFINFVIEDIKAISMDFNEKDESITENMLNMVIDYPKIESNFWQMVNEKFPVINDQRLGKETIIGFLKEKVYSLDEIAKKDLEREQNRNNEETREQDNKKKFDFGK